MLEITRSNVTNFLQLQKRYYNLLMIFLLKNNNLLYGYSVITDKAYYGIQNGNNMQWLEMISDLRLNEECGGTFAANLNSLINNANRVYFYRTNANSEGTPYKEGQTAGNSAGVVMGFNNIGSGTHGIQVHLTTGRDKLGTHICARSYTDNSDKGWSKWTRLLKTIPSDESYIIPISCDCSKVSPDKNGYYVFQLEVPPVLNTYCDVVATLQNVSSTFTFTISNIFSKIVTLDKNYIEIRFKTDCVQNYTFNCLVAPKKSLDYVRVL